MSHAQNDVSMCRVYPTKVDWWIGLILIFTIAVLIGSAVPFFIGPPAQSLLGLGIGVLCLALAVWTGWIPFNTNYEIEQTELAIRSAGFRWRVPHDSIVEVVPTHNPLSSVRHRRVEAEPNLWERSGLCHRRLGRHWVWGRGGRCRSSFLQHQGLYRLSEAWVRLARKFTPPV